MDESQEINVLIEEALLSQKVQSWISVISYCLLILTTFIIGFGYINSKWLERRATFVLVLIWILLLSTECIRLRRIHQL